MRGMVAHRSVALAATLASVATEPCGPGQRGTPPHMHVWHQGRKVTGRVRDLGRPYYSWRFRQYVYPQVRRPARAMPTIGDRAKSATTIAGAGGYSFRLIDVHGKVTGGRWRRVGPHRESEMLYATWEYLVEDSSGRQRWMCGRTRIRIVNQQPEDLLSQASRIINRLHRQLTKEDR